MSELYLSRLTLNPNPPSDLLDTFVSSKAAEFQYGLHHKLVWLPFADTEDRTRDFLWRAMTNEQFLVLSKRPPMAHDLFLAPEVKRFAPQLSPGDELNFLLRVNATRARAAARPTGTKSNGGKDYRVDIVMDRLHDVPTEKRAIMRLPLAEEAAGEWMAKQGDANGFRLEGLKVEDYSVAKLGRRGGKMKTMGVLDLSGTIMVTDPASFIERIAQGFGRSKAFGCGLMLLRR